MISLTDYWNDRDSRYRMECTEEIQRNAQRTVDKVNTLLIFAEADGIVRDKVASGWRPKGVNDLTCNAATGSNHLLALACDIFDPDRKFAQWCLNNQDKLDKIGLWMEDPRWTVDKKGLGWTHLQVIPPKSGKRVYIPNNKPPSGSQLQGQKPLPNIAIV